MTDKVYETLDALAATRAEKQHLTITLRTLYDYAIGEIDYQHLGGFAKAVVRNDLVSATARADKTNYKFIKTIASFAHFEIPASKRNRNAFRK